MNTKILLLLLMIGALAVIIVGLIATESLFKNQHTFKNTADINCTECHDDIYQELTSDIDMPHYDKSCTDCHQHPSVFTVGDEHAASGPVQCQSCHLNSVAESAALPGTIGFNYSSNEPHRDLFDSAMADSLLGGANEACAICHTNYDIALTFSRPDFYEFTIDYGTGTFDGGKLNATPDRLVVSGKADVTNLDAADDIFWRDLDSDSDWDPGEDIFHDDGDSTYSAGDDILYVGSDGQDTFGSAVEFGTEQEVFYMDSDHDGAYDYAAGTEEPLVFVGLDGGSVTDDSNLISTHEVLSPATSVRWIVDAVNFSTTQHYFLDNDTGTPGTFDAGEPIILDDGNGIIESGVLNGAGSADNVITSGYPDVTDFVAADRVAFRDINNDNTWNADEDIVYDSDNDNLFDYFGTIFDYTLYMGSGFDLSNGSGLKDIIGLKYIDSDHSGNYTRGEPIINSTDLILDSGDELILREDDNYDNGTKVFGLWDFDRNPFTAEFFIDDNNNGIYDDGEAIIRETYRIFDITFSGTEESNVYINYSADASGLHVFRNGTNIWKNSTGISLCGDAGVGCHQDVYNAINDGFGGGHYTNSTLGGHLETSDCSFCHRDSQQIDPDNDHIDAATGGWHSSKRVTCAYEGGCHSNLFTGGLMQEVFSEIQKVNQSIRGDICWSCHRGDFDWSDPTGKTYRAYVEDEAASQQVRINGLTVYSPTNYAGCACHNDTLANVPEVPKVSSKFPDHYATSAGSFDQCSKCHQEPADPHNDSHSINMDWSTWETDYGKIIPEFCGTTCHYSVNDARPKYVDTNTSWMAIEYANWLRNGGKHSLSTILGGDNLTAGSSKCTSCHTTHDTVPGCTDSGCHLDNDAIGTKRDVPDSHDTVSPGIINADRQPCARSDCHNGGGHKPEPPGCHFTGGYGCAPNTNGHDVHALPASNYVYDCSECHFDSALGYNNGIGTNGGSLHNNGVVNVAFDTTGNGTSTYGGALTGGNLPSYAGSGQSCTNTYCHSNGNLTSAGPNSGFLRFVTPGWNSSNSLNCGDCHGVPNYYNGTAWREMGTSITMNTETHLKHTRNFGGIYTSRNMTWVDAAGNASDTTPPYGWQDTIFDPGEALIQDGNNNRMLDYGVLNGGNNQAASTPQSPDKIYLAGKADLRDFVGADGVWFWDSNTNGDWDRDEDLYVETGGGGNALDEYSPSKGDYLIYQGVNANITADDNTNTVLYTSAGNTNKRVMYLDSDHDNVYDLWYSTGISKYSGTEEPLILAASDKATGDDLADTDEVLRNTQMYLFYNTDFNRWNSLDCSECHYNNAPIQGYGTYNTTAHVDMNKTVIFDWTSDGIASKFGTYKTQVNASGSWDSNAKQCYGVYCHSDGYERDATDSTPAGNGLPDWSGTGIYDDSSNYDTHTVKPNWTDRKRTTVFCGSCHYGWDKPADDTNGIDKPNTGAHRQGQHLDANQFGWHSGNDAVLCQECHWRYDTYNTATENQWWRAYGSDKHVDGSVWRGSDTWNTPGLFGPLSESQSYSNADGCHNTWPGSWRSGYGSGC